MFKSVILDFVQGWNNRELWLYNSLMDMRQRYRRSLIGPFWITLSLAIMVFSIGNLWAYLWKIDMKDYLPYFTVGLLLWTLISTIISESSEIFIKSNHIIKQVNLPFSFYIYNLVWKNFIIFFHHLIVYLLVIVIFKVKIGLSIFMVIPGLFFYFITALWMSSCLGIVCTRYRDIEQIIPSLLTIIFFVTPIMWKIQWSNKDLPFMDYNPLYHYIEILRAPLLGNMPTIDNYIVVSFVTIVGILISVVTIGKYRSQISYWL